MHSSDTLSFDAGGMARVVRVVVRKGLGDSGAPRQQEWTFQTRRDGWLEAGQRCGPAANCPALPFSQVRRRGGDLIALPPELAQFGAECPTSARRPMAITSRSP